MNDRKTVLVADNQYLIVEGLQKILAESEVFRLLAIVRSPDELEKYLSQNSCDILIVDISILDPNDIQKLGDLKTMHPGTGIVVLSNQVNRNEVGNLSRMGIGTILFKNAGQHEIFEAILAALKGKKYYSPEVVEMLLETKDKTGTATSLTVTEKDIVCLIADGLTTKEIADRKNISFHTVMTHRKNIFRKLGINNVSEMLMYAIKSGMIDNIEYYI